MTMYGRSIAALSLAALAAAGCSGGDSPTPPPPVPRPASVAVVSAPAAGDTIGSTLPALLVVEVRDSAGAPLPAATVTLRAAQTGAVQLASPGSDAFQDFLQLPTGADGRASARIRLGTVAGVVNVEAVAGPATTAHGVTVLPGAPVALAVSPLDTAVFGPYTLSAAARDRAGNDAGAATVHPASGAVRVTASPIAGFVVSAPGGGLHEVVVRAGALSATARFLAVPAGAAAVALDRTPEGRRLTLFNLDGTASRAMTGSFGSNGGDMAPSWAPDGRSVVFHEGYTPSELVRVDLEERYQRLVVTTGSSGGAFWPEFSRDGEWIYFSMREATAFANAAFTLWRVRATGAQAERVGPLQDYRYDGPASPSPDGARLVYSTASANPDEVPQLRFLDVRTGAVEDPGMPGTAARWSPRGDLIAYLTRNVLLVMTPDRSAGRVLAQGTRFENALHWSPDGEWLIARTVEPGRLMVIHVETGRAIPLPFDTSKLWQAAWKP